MTGVQTCALPIFTLLGFLVALVLDARRTGYRVPVPAGSAATLRTLGAPSSRSSLFVVLAAVGVGLAVSWSLIPVMIILALTLVSQPKRQLPWMVATVVFFAAANAATLWTVHQFLTRDITWPSRVPYANTLTWLGLAFWLVYVVTTSDRPEQVHIEGDDVPDEIRERRRGLNMPELRLSSSSPAETDLLDIVVAPRGLLRTFALARAQFNRRRNPALFEKVRTTDTINQIVGTAPLYNRRVLHLSHQPQSFGEILEQRGARVTTVVRATPPAQRGYVPPNESAGSSDGHYTVLTIPAREKSFDLVYATNVLSSVPDSIPLLNEMIRVTQPGGAIVIHNATWWSWWGGFETSPWHLISGSLARRRFIRKHQSHPVNSFGFTLFRYRIKDIVNYLESDDRVVVVAAGPYWLPDRKSTRLNSSHIPLSRMPSSA